MKYVDGVLLKVDNYETNPDRKFVISVTKEACPENVLKYQHEKVRVLLELAEDGIHEYTLSKQEQMHVLLSHAATIADAAQKLVAMVKEELEPSRPEPEDFRMVDTSINNQQEGEEQCP